jgi:hypothetical protein
LRRRSSVGSECDLITEVFEAPDVITVQALQSEALGLSRKRVYLLLDPSLQPLILQDRVDIVFCELLFSLQELEFDEKPHADNLTAQ